MAGLSSDSVSYELPHHWPRYKPLRVLGEGGFGVVYLCIDSTLQRALKEENAGHQATHTADDGAIAEDENDEMTQACLVAVKAIPLSALSDAEVVLAMNEVSLLRNISHPNILKYLDCFNDSTWQQLCLVTEYVDGGDLASLIRQHQGRPHKSRHTRDHQGGAASSSPTRKRARAVSTSLDDGRGVEEDGSPRDDRFERRVAHVHALSDRFDDDDDAFGDEAAWASGAAAGAGPGAGASWDSTDASFFPQTPLGASEAGMRWGTNDASDSRSRVQYTRDDGAASATGLDDDDDDGEAGGRDVEWIESFLITDIIRQCLDGLAYLHSLAIVHRDVKPSNIYLTKSGTVRIGDFGIAKLLNASDPFTSTFVGTPFYLAPEVCLGDLYSFGADVWALGVVTYELYCLKLPFAARNVLAQIHLVSEGRYDHERLLTPHEFPPAQLIALHALYGEAQFERSEAVLHSLVVSLVEQALTVDAGARPAAETILMDTFGVVPSYLNLTGTSLTSLPLAAGAGTSQRVGLGNVWSRPASAQARTSRPATSSAVIDTSVRAAQTAQQEREQEDATGIKSDTDHVLELNGASQEPSAIADVLTLDSPQQVSSSMQSPLVPARPPLVPNPKRAATPTSSPSHTTTPAGAALLPRAPARAPARGGSILLRSGSLGQSDGGDSRPQSRAARLSAFVFAELPASRPASSWDSTVGAAAAVAQEMSVSTVPLATRVQASFGALVSSLPESRRASLHAVQRSSAVWQHAPLDLALSQPPPLLSGCVERTDSLNASTVDTREAEDADTHHSMSSRHANVDETPALTLRNTAEDKTATAAADEDDADFAPWLHNADVFSSIALHPDSDAVLLVEPSTASACANSTRMRPSLTAGPTITGDPIPLGGAALVEFTKPSFRDPTGSSSRRNAAVRAGCSPSQTKGTPQPGGTVDDTASEGQPDAAHRIDVYGDASLAFDAGRPTSGPRRVSLLMAPQRSGGHADVQDTLRSRADRASLLSSSAPLSVSRPSSRLRTEAFPESAAGARVRPISAARLEAADLPGTREQEMRRISTPSPSAPLAPPSPPPPAPPETSPSPPSLPTPLTTSSAPAEEAAPQRRTEPDAESPGVAEPEATVSMSTAQIEQLLRAKLLAHHAHRHKYIQTQRAQQAALEAVRARLRMQLTALYGEALAQALPVTSDTTLMEGAAISPTTTPASASAPPPQHTRTHAPNVAVLTTAPTARPLSATVDTIPSAAPGSPLRFDATQRPLLSAEATREVQSELFPTTTAATSAKYAPPKTVSTRPPSADVLDATVRQLLEHQSTPPPHLAVTLAAGGGDAPPPSTEAAEAAPDTQQAWQMPEPSTAGDMVTSGGALCYRERLQRLWSAEAETRVTSEAHNAAAVARWRSAFAVQPPRRYQIAPVWVPPRRDAYFTDLWESSSVEDDAEEVTDAELREQCLALMGMLKKEDAATNALQVRHPALVTAPAARPPTVVCYREGLRRGRQKPVLPPPSALEAVQRWRWSCPPSCDDEEASEASEESEEDESSGQTSATSDSERVVRSRSSLARARVAAKGRRPPHSAHPDRRRRSGDHTKVSTQSYKTRKPLTAAEKVSARRAASAPEAKDTRARKNEAGVSPAPVRPRPLAEVTSKVVATPALASSLYILKGIDAVNRSRLQAEPSHSSSLSDSPSVSSTNDDEEEENSDGRVEQKRMWRGKKQPTSQSSEETTTDEDSEADRISTDSSSSSSSSDDDDDEDEEDDAYLYTALYYTPEALPQVPTPTDANEKRLTVPSRQLCRFFDYTLPVTLVLTASVPGTEEKVASRLQQGTAPPIKGATPPVSAARERSSRTANGKEPERGSRMDANEAKDDARTASPSHSPRSPVFPPELTTDPARQPPPPPVPLTTRATAAKTVVATNALSVVGTTMATGNHAGANPVRKPVPEAIATTSARKQVPRAPPPKEKSMKPKTQDASTSQPDNQVVPITRYLRSDHRPLPITLALRPLHDRTRLSGLLWRVLFSLGQCQLDMSLFASALQQAEGHSHQGAAMPLVVLPVCEDGDSTAPAQGERPPPPRVCKAALRAPRQGGTLLREQLALYFYEPHTPTAALTSPSAKHAPRAEAAGTSSHAPLCIRIDSEAAWRRVRHVWAAQFAQRAFMRLYLVVPQSALE